MRAIWIGLAVTLGCSASPAASPAPPEQDASPAAPEAGPAPEPEAAEPEAAAPAAPDAAPEAEAAAPPECTAVVAGEPMPVDCASTHGLMFCAGRGDNGCVLCPVDSTDAGLQRHFDCDQNGANGCETAEGPANCGGCGIACGAGQRCVDRWASAPDRLAYHCE